MKYPGSAENYCLRVDKFNNFRYKSYSDYSKIYKAFIPKKEGYWGVIFFILPELK